MLFCLCFQFAGAPPLPFLRCGMISTILKKMSIYKLMGFRWIEALSCRCFMLHVIQQQKSKDSLGSQDFNHAKCCHKMSYADRTSYLKIFKAYNPKMEDSTILLNEGQVEPFLNMGITMLTKD